MTREELREWLLRHEQEEKMFVNRKSGKTAFVLCDNAIDAYDTKREMIVFKSFPSLENFCMEKNDFHAAFILEFDKAIDDLKVYLEKECD